ncbi:MAG: hypothetical protein R3E97_03800 [Candidatus Eisenbacteria bacterium]
MHGSTTSRSKLSLGLTVRVTLAALSLLACGICFGIGCAPSIPVDRASRMTATDQSGSDQVDSSLPEASEKSETPDLSSPGLRSILIEGLGYLAKSRRDSCAVCAERNRDDAFERLNLALLPGTRYSAEGTMRETMRLTKGAAPYELEAASYSPEPIGFVFRFHTSSEHLVGVSPNDWTTDAIAETWSAAAVGTEFEGELELVEYAYGDGPTYLYSPSEGRVELQSRVLTLRALSPH